MKPFWTIVSALLFLSPGSALAHTGTGGTGGFLHGFGHPVSGTDHLLAMLAVGLLASQARGRDVWAIPLMFVAAMILGGAVGIAGVSVPYVEAGILASVLVFGLLVAGVSRLSMSWTAPIVGLFAGLHGHAHGAEMPLAVGAGAYTAGFVTATTCLLAVGLGLGELLRRSDLSVATRAVGGVVAMAGLVLVFT